MNMAELSIEAAVESVVRDIVRDEVKAHLQTLDLFELRKAINDKVRLLLTKEYLKATVEEIDLWQR